MKVKVTRRDIEDGRTRANSRCGCPIWHALARKLRIQDAESHLEVPCVYQATLGRIKMRLPQKAIEFQNQLIKNPEARVRPFEFETDVIAPK